MTQEFKNPLLNPIFVSLRECSGQRVIHRGGAVLQLYKTLHRGGRVAILTDLTIPAQLPTVAIDCFGLKTSVTFAHAWAHRRAGATIINVHCEPLPGGRYRIVFHPPIKFPPDASFQEIAQACWNQFEPHVRANPAPWMWMCSTGDTSRSTRCDRIRFMPRSRRLRTSRGQVKLREARSKRGFGSRRIYERSWKSFRHWVEWLGVQLGTFLIPLFPRRVFIEGIGSTIGWTAASVHRNGRHVALSNLECVFGAALKPAQRKGDRPPVLPAFRPRHDPPFLESAADACELFAPGRIREHRVLERRIGTGPAVILVATIIATLSGWG